MRFTTELRVEGLEGRAGGCEAVVPVVVAIVFPDPNPVPAPPIPAPNPVPAPAAPFACSTKRRFLLA